VDHLPNSEFPRRLGIDEAADGGQRTPHTPPLPGIDDDWRKLKRLSGSITQAHDSGNREQVSRLEIAKDALQGIMGEYDRDSRLEAKIKADSEFASQLKEIRDVLKGKITSIDKAPPTANMKKSNS
jgi:hypothetical protein